MTLIKDYVKYNIYIYNIDYLLWMYRLSINTNYFGLLVQNT